MKLVIVALVVVAALVPAFAVMPTAEACQPRSWICPLNGEWYHTCGTASVPPVAQCAGDTLRDLTLP